MSSYCLADQVSAVNHIAVTRSRDEVWRAGGAGLDGGGHHLSRNSVDATFDAGRFLRAAAVTAAHRGIDPKAWFEVLDIEPELLGGDRSRITAEQATQMVQKLWLVTGDELGGLGSEPAPRGTFRMLALALLSSPDVRTALERMVDFSRVLPAFPPCAVTMGESTTRLQLDLRSEDDPAYLMTDLGMAVIVRFFAWLAGRRLPIERVELPYPAQYSRSWPEPTSRPRTPRAVIR